MSTHVEHVLQVKVLDPRFGAEWPLPACVLPSVATYRRALPKRPLMRPFTGQTKGCR